MKNLSKILIALLVVCSFAQKIRAAEDDPVKLMPKSYRVALENHQVRVLNVWLKPGMKTPMHSHPDSVIFVEEGGLVRFTDEHGKSTTTRLRSGQILWRNDEDHMAQNLSRHTVHVLQIELKGVRFF
jgi:quercetin dioxygenase-like cupin family protein